MKVTKLNLKLVKKQMDVLTMDKAAKLGLRLLFSGLGLSFLWLAGWWFKLPPQVPLIYSRPYGESRLVSQWSLWLLPVLSLIISLISIRAASNFIEKDRLLAQILVWSATITTLIILVTLVKIILLVA